MEVIVAKTAGFCFGVHRAVKTVYDEIEKQQAERQEITGTIYTLGPIIHNEEVVSDLEKRGVIVLETEQELDGLDAGTVIIRSHGVGKAVYDKIERKHLRLVDATCPFVKRIHKLVEKASRNNEAIVIVGNASHPEVEGIKGWAYGDVFVIADEKEAESVVIAGKKKVCLVSQTTFNYKKFKLIVEILEKKGYDIEVNNSICNATYERQHEAREVARQVDAMIVIGGRHSSNTQKLYELCKEECDNTYYIQTLSDLDLKQIQSAGVIGITAGASTPNKIIEEVKVHVRTEF